MPSPSVDISRPTGKVAAGGRLDVLIVGNAGGTNVGASFCRGAARLGINAHLCDSLQASAGSRLLRAFNWRVRGHRPAYLGRFGSSVVQLCRAQRPRVLLSTGLAPLSAKHLSEIGEMGIRRLNYLTDDPWNRAFAASWFFDALPHYDQVFSVRRGNMEDLRARGCRLVEYLPFAFDEELFGCDAPGEDEAEFDTVFVGGADRDRLPYIRAILDIGCRVALVGDYWGRSKGTRCHTLGHLLPEQLRRITRRAKTAICLVRRANRDGHVMRSFEIPAIGTCMLAEDTAEHRDLFGDEGAAVLYFRTIPEMTDKLKWLLVNDAERLRMGRTAHSLVVNGGHTYTDRLRTMLEPGEPACPKTVSIGSRAACRT
jgi:spore maturation protein CgeB